MAGTGNRGVATSHRTQLLQAWLLLAVAFGSLYWLKTWIFDDGESWLGTLTRAGLFATLFVVCMRWSQRRRERSGDGSTP